MTTNAEPIGAPPRPGDDAADERRTSPGSTTVMAAAGAGGFVLGSGFLLAWIGMGPAAMQWLGERMKANTALCLALLSATLPALAWSGRADRVARVARWLPVLAMIIGAATLFEYLAGVNLGLDQLLARDFPSPESARFPGRMSPIAALSFVLLGAALVLGPSPSRARARAGQALALVVIGGSLLPLVGYLYDASVLYQPTRYIRISPYTAGGIGVVAIGVLALRPDLGLARLMVSRGSGGYLTRPLLLLAIVGPLLFGWLRLEGEHLGLFSTATGTSLLVLATIGTFVLVVLVLARSLERVDVRRRAAEAELRRSAGLTAALARAATVDEVVEVTLRLGLPALGASAGGVMLVSEDNQQLTMTSSRGYADAVVSQYLTIPAADALPASEALRSAAPVFVATPEEYRRRYPSVLADLAATRQTHEPHESWAALPVHGRDRIIAVLGLSFRERHAFTEPERERLAQLAWQCGQALDRALLFDSLKQVSLREQRARESAEDANRAKDEFMAMLGHELRNPLSPILTALQLMKMRADDSQRKERAIIERQVQHMVRLVDDLLDVSRITRGKIELKRQRVELADIVAKAIEVASPLFEERKHRLVLDVQPGLSVIGDAHRLTQVLSNLLTNAAKYTERGGLVSVTAKADEGTAHAVIRVRDSGIGISAELLPRIFDLFVQGHRTHERSAAGLGLGLSIVRMLTEMHGGRVLVASAGPGQGSEFSLLLPRDPGAAGAGTREVTPAVSVTTELTAVSARRHDPHRILVVDDNRDAAELLAEALEMEGHDVRVAFDGPSALAAAAELRPELAFLDIGLPVMDGYELARRLRGMNAGPLRLVAITGYGQAADRLRSAEAGFDQHLVKPIDLDTALAIADDPDLRARPAIATGAGAG